MKRTFYQRLIELGYSSYEGYLQSDHWKELKDRFFRSGLYAKGCYCCFKINASYNLHHRSYARLGYEKLSDLILVCRDWPREHADRDPNKPPVKDLLAQLGLRVNSFVSQNGHGHDFWVASALWESFTEEALRDRNKRLLHRLLEDHQIAAFCDTVDDLYESLLWKVKTAAEANWRLHKEQKMLKRQDLLDWLIAEASPLPNLNHDQRLEKKLHAAGLDEVAVDSAKALRRQYNIELRQPRFLDIESSAFYSSNVPAILHCLRSELDSGRRIETGTSFHQSCIERVLEIPKKRPAQVKSEATEDFLLGCMYEVTARCRHRFTTPKS